MKRFFFFFSLSFALATSPLWGSNRADINRDHSVDATDQAILSNLLAGNLDLADYDLENVVVVAEQGGDYSYIHHAMSWVHQQNPSETKRFLVLVAPGVYEVSGAFRVYMRDYTTLRGMSKEQTIIVSQDEDIYSPVKVDGKTDAVIENLTLINNCTDTGVVDGIEIHDPDNVIIRNCHIEVHASNSSCRGINIWGSGTDQGVRVEDCDIVVEHGAPGVGEARGIWMSADCDLWVTDTSITVDEYVPGSNATCIMQYGMPSDDYFIKAYRCRLYPTSVSGSSRFFERNNFDGLAFFYATEVSGSATTTDTWFVNCYTETGVYP